jgi:hypothetical protein
MAIETDNPVPCTVRDGKFLEPCWALAGSVAEAGFKASGIHIRSLTDFKARQPSRTFAVVRTKGGDRNDIILNFCPFCGERIDAPWREEMQPEKTEPAATKDPLTFFAESDISIKEAIARALAHAETIKAPVTLHYKGWWTGINPTDKATTIFDRYCTRHVTPYDVSDYEPAKGASIVEAANGAIREATSKGPVRLIFNDWKRIVRHYDGLSTLLHEWQQFQAGKETRHG